MQYHKASHIGHERSRMAQMKLFDYTGFAMLTYTIKQDQNGFAPVGDEMLLARIVRENQAMLFYAIVMETLRPNRNLFQ